MIYTVVVVVVVVVVVISTPGWLGCVDAVSQETRRLQGPIIVHCK